MPQADKQKGLTERQVLAAREQHGWNELPTVARTGPLRVLLRQFSNLLVLILIIAAAIAIALGEHIDAATIGLVVVLNAILGFVQEWKAENALASLRKLLSPQAMVIRDGQEQLIPARDIVPGDLLALAPGVKISADATLIRAIALDVDESVLTGESLPVAKETGDGTAQVFAGTSVTAGRAEAQVTATGTNTEFGKIAKLTGAVETKTTNLQAWSACATTGDRRRAGCRRCYRSWHHSGAGSGRDGNDGPVAVGRHGAGRAACRRYDHSCAGCHDDGPPKRTGTTTASRRDAGCRVGHLYRQNRYTDREQDDCDRCLDLGQSI